MPNINDKPLQPELVGSDHRSVLLCCASRYHITKNIMVTNSTSRSTPNWGPKDTDIMLDLVQEILPYGQNEWQRVADLYNRHDAMTHLRDADAVRRKFMKLKNTLKPTGHPTCPPHVRRAKHIWTDIEGRASVLGLYDGQDSEPDDAAAPTDNSNEAGGKPMADGADAADNYGPQGAVDHGPAPGGDEVHELDDNRDGNHDNDR